MPRRKPSILLLQHGAARSPPRFLAPRRSRRARVHEPDVVVNRGGTGISIGERSLPLRNEGFRLRPQAIQRELTNPTCKVESIVDRHIEAGLGDTVEETRPHRRCASNRRWSETKKRPAPKCRPFMAGRDDRPTHVRVGLSTTPDSVCHACTSRPRPIQYSGAPGIVKQGAWSLEPFFGVAERSSDDDRAYHEPRRPIWFQPSPRRGGCLVGIY